MIAKAIFAQRHRLTLDALADVNDGHVIDHQAVQAWATSLGTDRPLPAPLWNRPPTAGT